MTQPYLEDASSREEAPMAEEQQDDGAAGDVRGRLAEAERQRAEGEERERILELEVAALRRDLDVKVAYNEALERAATERRRYTEWLQSQVESERERCSNLTTQAAALAAELAAERARISYRLAQRVVALLRPTNRR
jgi:hypothetical protein